MIQRFADNQVELGVSERTVKAVYCFLKSALQEAAPPRTFDINLPKHIAYKVEVLTVSEQRRLEAAAEGSDPIDHIGVMLCLYTGIRIGELCGLKWEDVDFERNQIYIRRTVQRIRNFGGDSSAKSGVKNKTVVASLSPKSDSSQRDIPIPTFISELLAEHRSSSGGWGGGGFVISRNGLFIEPRNLQYRFQKLLENANVKRVNFHATRHTFATRALENGFDVKTLSEILGHSSATVTLNKYAHSLDENKRRRMESLVSVHENIL